MVGYFRFVLRHRALFLGTLVAITAIAASQFHKAIVATSLGKLFLGESAAYDSYLEHVSKFGSDELLIVAYEDDDVLGAESLRRLQKALDRIDTLPDVARTQSVLDTQRIFLSGDDEFIEGFIQGVTETPDIKIDALKDLTEDLLAQGTIISRDAKHAAVVVTLADPSERDMESNVHLVDSIWTIFIEEGFPEDKLHRAGSVAVVSEMMAQTRFNVKKLFPFVCVLLMVTVFVIFRRFWPVIVSTSVAVVAVIWTMGVAIWMDPQINILLAAVPAVILIIAFSDVIHLCSAYLLELGDGDVPKDDAILRSAADVGTACVFTSITTFVGFLCLSLVPTPVFRQMGFILGLGVGVALLIAMTLVPILFSIMPKPKPWRRSGAASRTQDLLDRVLESCASVSTTYPRSIIACFAALLVACGVGISQIEIENVLSSRFSKSNQVRKDVDYFLEHFAGTNVLDIYVNIDTEGTSDFLDPENYFRVAAFQDAVHEIPAVDAVLSPVTLLRVAHAANTPEGEDPTDLPRDRQELEQYLTALELFDAESLGDFISPDSKTVRLLARLHEKGLRETYRTGEAARALASDHLPEHTSVEPTGMSYLIGGWLGELLIGQKRGLLVSFVTIAFLMTLALQSIRSGLWSMIPNLLPLIALGGYVGLFWEKVDSDTFMVAMLAIGIGVDDTIHFLVRYRLEAAREPDRTKALQNTFHFAGRGIVITTIILTIGFAPFAASDYFSLQILGTLLPMVLVMALLADVLLVPALGKVGILEFPGPKSNDAPPR